VPGKEENSVVQNDTVSVFFNEIGKKIDFEE
jgi:hypothetical protein